MDISLNPNGTLTEFKPLVVLFRIKKVIPAHTYDIIVDRSSWSPLPHLSQQYQLLCWAHSQDLLTDSEYQQCINFLQTTLII